MVRVRFCILALCISLSSSFFTASLWLNFRLSRECRGLQVSDVGLFQECGGSQVDGGANVSEEEFAEEYVSLDEQVKKFKKGKLELEPSLHYFRTRRKKANKDNFFIAVVTTERYLKTRAIAILQTWAKEVQEPSKLSFFVGEDCYTSDPILKDMPIIKIKGIKDNIYPPQKKVFAVLKYIHANYGNRFKWIVRADDDVYIRVGAFEKMLANLDWTKLLVIGHPGYGKDKDRQRLKLLRDENYCMGGPGVVFSMATLQALGPYLDKCLKGLELYNRRHSHDEGWYNEDVELGRCASRTLGIGCTSQPETSRFDNGYFTHIYDTSLSTLWKKPVLSRAVTVHPVKKQDDLFRLHYFYKQLDKQALTRQLENIKSQLKHLCKSFSDESLKKDDKAMIKECFQ